MGWLYMAQHVKRNGRYAKENDIKVSYAIHPVAENARSYERITC